MTLILTTYKPILSFNKKRIKCELFINQLFMGKSEYDYHATSNIFNLINHDTLWENLTGLSDTYVEDFEIAVNRLCFIFFKQSKLSLCHSFAHLASVLHKLIIHQRVNGNQQQFSICFLGIFAKMEAQWLP